MTRTIAYNEAIANLGVVGADSGGHPAAITEAEARFFIEADRSRTEVHDNDNEQENVSDDDKSVDEESIYHDMLLHSSSHLSNLTNLTFKSISGREMNDHQQEKFTSYKNACCNIVEYMMTLGLVVDPASYLYSRIVNIDELLDMNNEKSHIYRMPLKGKVKVGQTSNGRKRIAKYKEKMKDPILRSMTDLDNINFDIQPELTKRILNLAKMFSPKEYPTTLGQVLLLDKYGLPAALQIRFLSLVKSAEECKNCGGALALRGVLIDACAHFIFETGVQVSLTNRGVDITGDVHEAPLNDCTKLAVNLDKEVNDNIDYFIMNVLSDEERQFVHKNKIVSSANFNSWPPGKLASTPEKFVSATECVMDKIFEE